MALAVPMMMATTVTATASSTRSSEPGSVTNWPISQEACAKCEMASQ